MPPIPPRRTAYHQGLHQLLRRRPKHQGLENPGIKNYANEETDDTITGPAAADIICGTGIDSPKRVCRRLI